ncbi:AAA family ATPase [Empedobacter tilapiae]
MEHISISKHIIELVKQYRYNKTVFILPPWKEIYRTDNERKQDWNEAELTFEKMKETYVEFGYNIILVPKMTLQERIKFVQQNIEKL